MLLIRLVRILNPFAELQEIEETRHARLLQRLGQRFPLLETELFKTVSLLDGEQDTNWNLPKLQADLESLVTKGHLVKVKTALATRYEIRS